MNSIETDNANFEKKYEADEGNNSSNGHQYTHTERYIESGDQVQRATKRWKPHPPRSGPYLSYKSAPSKSADDPDWWLRAETWQREGWAWVWGLSQIQQHGRGASTRKGVAARNTKANGVAA